MIKLLSIILTVVFFGNFAKSQDSQRTSKVLENISNAIETQWNINIDLDIEVSHPMEGVERKNIIYSVINKIDNELGYVFYAYDKETGAKQWLCDSLIYILDSSQQIIKTYEFNKSAYSNYINNPWNYFVVKYFSPKFPYNILKSKYLLDYKLELNEISNQYILRVRNKNKDGFPVSTEEYTFSKDNYFLVTLKVEEEFNGLKQISNFKVNDIRSNALTNFCDLINKFSEFKIITNTSNKANINTFKSIDAYTHFPEFKFVGENNSSLSHTQLHDYTLLYFWFISCYPCHQSTPIIGKLDRLYNSKIDFYSINMGDPEEKIKTYKVEQGVNFKVLFIDNEMAKKFGIIEFPLVILIDKERKILFRRVGYNEKLFKELKEVIDKHIGG